uniref:Inorganic phosphate cotransporter n=1 Tax=Timema tahoe TaxID=61484 RepID=A0A7R9NZ88_9NEOP|nr:unnamed protein product [Timema tahoe]
MATKRKAVIQDTEILAIFIDSSTQSDQFVCHSESTDSEFVNNETEQEFYSSEIERSDLVGVAADIDDTTSIGPAVTLILITVIGCNPVWIIVLLAINGLCMGTQYTGNSMNLIALAPNFAGTTYGLCNTFSSSVGILAPYVTGFLTKNNQTRTQWNLVFYTSAAVSVITFIFYMALCTDEEQPWNNPHPDIAMEPMNKKPKSELDKMKSNESFSQLSLQLA